MEASENALKSALDNRKITKSSYKTYKKYLALFHNRNNAKPITPESAKEYIDSFYVDRAKNTRRLLTMILNTYVLLPSNQERLKVPPKDRGKKTLKNHFTNREVAALIAQAKANNFIDLYHCLNIAACTGMRINEILCLTCEDIITACTKYVKDVSPIEITVLHGKGDKMRNVPVCQKDSEYFLKELLPLSLTKPLESRIFACGYDNFRKQLKFVMETIGIYDNKKMGFHGLRSHFCTQRYGQMKKQDIQFADKVVQHILGHSDYATTKGYIRPEPDAVLEYALSLR